MRNGLPVLAFVGHGRSGKDTCCEWLRDNTFLRFAGGCSYTVLPHVARALGLTTEEAWATRHDNRMFWYEWCNEYRREDPARIVRECLAHSDVVCGVRDGVELRAARDEGLVDVIVWVDRAVPADPTVAFTADDADLVLRNHGSLDDLYRRLRRLATALKIPFRVGC